MTATDELRRLLDERGVEWKATAKNRTVINGDWIVEEDVEATKYGDDTVFCAWTLTYHLTAEQVIEATLGPETCHDAAGEKMSFFSCSACGGTDMSKNPEFCHWCGRKVKQ